MRFTPKNRAQRVAAAGVIALSVLGVSSCSVVNEQATVRQYSPSDGIVADVGEAEVRNLLVVSNGDGAPGRLLGTVVNTSDQQMDFTLDLGGSNLSWPIAAGDKVVFDDFEDTDISLVTVANVDVLPGTGLRADAGAGTATDTLNVPVVDGTLKDYREFLPTPAATPSEAPTDAATDAGTGTGTETGAATEQPETP